MNSIIRSKLDMGDRVRAFCLAHPSDDPTQVELVARLGERIARAHTLVTQALAGQSTVHASVDSKDELRGLIRGQMFILAGIADLIAVDEPGLDARFEVPAANVSHQAFLGAAEAILKEVTPRREQFLAHGLPSTLLEEMTSLVGRYVGAVNEKQAGTSTHVGAHADLEKVIGEVMLIVHLLDRIHEVQYRRDSEMLASWKSASEVVGPARNGAESDPPATQPGPTGGLEERQPA